MTKFLFTIMYQVTIYIVMSPKPHQMTKIHLYFITAHTNLPKTWIKMPDQEGMLNKIFFYFQIFPFRNAFLFRLLWNIVDFRRVFS